MKHNSMSPFVSKLAGERGLLCTHVAASTLTRGFCAADYDGALEVISWEAHQQRFSQPTERLVRARGLQETLSPWILAHVASQKLGKLQSQRKEMAMGAHVAPETSAVHPGLLFMVHAKLITNRLVAWSNDAICCSHADKLQNQYVTWFQKGVCQLFCRTDHQKYMVSRRYWKEPCSCRPLSSHVWLKGSRSLPLSAWLNSTGSAQPPSL